MIEKKKPTEAPTKEGLIYPVLLHGYFVALLTSAMAGSTIFCMIWFETSEIPIFSDVIKHAPTNYLWDVACQAFMPMWYLTIFVNYLCICRRIEKFNDRNESRYFLGMSIQSWATLFLLLGWWGAYHFAGCTSIPIGRVDEKYRHLFGRVKIYENKLHKAFCHSSFFISALAQLGFILILYIAKIRKHMNHHMQLHLKSDWLLSFMRHFITTEQKKLTVFLVAIVSGILFSVMSENQIGVVLEYIAILGLVWGQIAWIPTLRRYIVAAYFCSEKIEEPIEPLDTLEGKILVKKDCKISSEYIVVGTMFLFLYGSQIYLGF